LGSSSYEVIIPHVVHLDSTFYLSPVLHMPACLTYEVILRTSEWAFENLGRLSPQSEQEFSEAIPTSAISRPIHRGPPDHIDKNASSLFEGVHTERRDILFRLVTRPPTCQCLPVWVQHARSDIRQDFRVLCRHTESDANS
jgi:hypothetical protein